MAPDGAYPLAYLECWTLYLLGGVAGFGGQLGRLGGLGGSGLGVGRGIGVGALGMSLV